MTDNADATKMGISIECDCRRRTVVADALVGQSFKCSECGRERVVPDFPGMVPDPTPVEEGQALPKPTRTSSRAVTGLVFGGLSLCFFPSAFLGVLFGILGSRDVRRSEGRLVGQGIAIAGTMLSLLGLSIWSAVLGLAIVDSLSRTKMVRGPTTLIRPTGPTRAQLDYEAGVCSKNCEQIGRAVLQFASANDALPPQAIVDPEGSPLLSWRVAILPYLGEEDLYNEFHLDEPWDSEHNLTLLPRMPELYLCPTDSDEVDRQEGLTYYQAFVGEGTVFDPGKITRGPDGVCLGIRWRDTVDGTPNSIMIGEAMDEVPWTCPEDVDCAPESYPLPIGSTHPAGFHVIFSDGTVRALPHAISVPEMKALVTRARRD